MLVNMQEHRQRQPSLAEATENRGRLWAIFLLFALSFAGVDGFAGGRIGEVKGPGSERYHSSSSSSKATEREIRKKLQEEESKHKFTPQNPNEANPFPAWVKEIARDSSGRFQHLEFYQPTPQERSKQLYQKVEKAVRASPLDFWSRDASGRFFQPANLDPGMLTLQRERQYQAATDVVATASALATANGNSMLTHEALKQNLLQLDKNWIVAKSVALSAGMTGAKLNDIHMLTVRSETSGAELYVNLRDSEGRPENLTGRVVVDLDVVVKAITAKGY